MDKTDTAFVQASPILAGPIPPAAPLPFFKYLRTVRNNAIAVFHQDVFNEWIIETRVWKLHTFIVNDPAGIKHVLVDNADNYIKGNIEPHISGAESGRFVAGEGEEWRERRRTMSSSFDYRSIAGNSSIILDAAQALLARWNALPQGTALEVFAEMATMTLEIILRIIFSSDSAELAPIMDRTFRRNQPERVLDLFDFVPLLDRPWAAYKRHKGRRSFRHFNESIDRLSAQRTRERTHSGDDLLGRLIREKDAETGRSLSAEEIHGQIITVVGAGHQSVALGLTWIWYLLSQHPLQEAVLHAELDRVLAGRVPALDDLARLPYTRMVLEETLRLYPPFPTMAWRGALADDEVCGVKIPKGATVSIAPWVLHRHKKLWDHPEQFDPERFSPDRSAGRSRYAYLPFGTGPRVCIGASFAMTEMMLVLATLAQRYRLRLVPGQKVEPQGLISLRPRYGLKMTVIEDGRGEPHPRQ
ncbi:MAG: cytochrome P450 [Silvibacterium sp.]